MKKTIPILLTLIITISIGYSMFQKPKTINDVKVGMSIEDVKKMIGLPTSQINGHIELSEWDPDGMLKRTDEGLYFGQSGQLVETSWIYSELRLDTIKTPQEVFDNAIRNNGYIKERNKETEEFNRGDGVDLPIEDTLKCITHSYQIALVKAVVFDRSTGTVSTVSEFPIAVLEINN